jgi:competence protein ComGC
MHNSIHIKQLNVKSIILQIRGKLKVKKAFTLIEIVIVIITMVAIITVSLPAYDKMKKRIEYSPASGFVELVRSAASYYLLRNGSFAGLATGDPAWVGLNVAPPSTSSLTYVIISGPQLEIRNRSGDWLYRYHLSTGAVERRTAHADYPYLPKDLP